MATNLRYEVRATAYHTGEPDAISPYAASNLARGIFSRHRTRKAAEAAAARHRMRDCSCGCAVVVDTKAE